MEFIYKHIVEIIGYSGLEGISLEKIFEELSCKSYYNKFRNLTIDESFQNHMINLLKKDKIISFYRILDPSNGSNGVTHPDSCVIKHSIKTENSEEYGVSEHYYSRQKLDTQTPMDFGAFLTAPKYSSIYCVASQKYRNFLLKCDITNDFTLETYCILELISRNRDKGLQQLSLLKNGIDSVRTYYEVSNLLKKRLIFKLENYALYEEVPQHLLIHSNFWQDNKIYQVHYLNRAILDSYPFDEYIVTAFRFIKNNSPTLENLFNFCKAKFEQLDAIALKNIIIFLHRCGIINLTIKGDLVKSKRFNNLFRLIPKFYYQDQASHYTKDWFWDKTHANWQIGIELVTKPDLNESDKSIEDTETHKADYLFFDHPLFKIPYEVPILAESYKIIQNSLSHGLTIQQLGTLIGMDYSFCRKIIKNLETSKLIYGKKYVLGKLQIKRYYTSSQDSYSCESLLPFDTLFNVENASVLSDHVKTFSAEHVKNTPSRSFYFENSLNIQRFTFVLNYMSTTKNLFKDYNKCLELLNSKETHLSGCKTTKESLEKLLFNMFLAKMISRVVLRIMYQNVMSEFFTYSMSIPEFTTDQADLIAYFADVVKSFINNKLSEEDLAPIISRSLKKHRYLNIDEYILKNMDKPLPVVVPETSTTFIERMYQYYTKFFHDESRILCNFPRLAKIKILHLFLFRLVYCLDDIPSEINGAHVNPIFNVLKYLSMSPLAKFPSGWVSLRQILDNMPLVLVIFLSACSLARNLVNTLIENKNDYLSPFSSLNYEFMPQIRKDISKSLCSLISILFLMRFVASSKNSIKGTFADISVLLLRSVELPNCGADRTVQSFAFENLSSVENFWSYLYFESESSKSSRNRFKESSFKTYISNLAVEDSHVVICHKETESLFGYPEYLNLSLRRNWLPSLISDPVRSVPPKAKPAPKTQYMYINRTRLFISSTKDSTLIYVFVILTLTGIEIAQFYQTCSESLTSMFSFNNKKHLIKDFSSLRKLPQFSTFIRKLCAHLHTFPEIENLLNRLQDKKSFMVMYNLVKTNMKKYMGDTISCIESLTPEMLVCFNEADRRPNFFHPSSPPTEIDDILKLFFFVFIKNKDQQISKFVNFLFTSLGFDASVNLFRRFIKFSYFQKISKHFVSDDKKTLECLTALVDRYFNWFTASFQTYVNSISMTPFQPSGVELSLNTLSTCFYFHLKSKISIQLQSNLSSSSSIDSSTVSSPISSQLTVLPSETSRIEFNNPPVQDAHLLLAQYLSYRFGVGSFSAESIAILLLDGESSDSFFKLKQLCSNLNISFEDVLSFYNNISHKFDMDCVGSDLIASILSNRVNIENLKQSVYWSIFHHPGIKFKLLFEKVFPIMNESILKRIIDLLIVDRKIRVVTFKPLSPFRPITSMFYGISFSNKIINRPSPTLF